MSLQTIKYKPYKSVTNGENSCKIYVEKIIEGEQVRGISIRKYHLTDYELPYKEFTLIKQYKDMFLYEEFITLKYHTLMSICATVFDWDTFNAMKNKTE